MLDFVPDENFQFMRLDKFICYILVVIILGGCTKSYPNNNNTPNIDNPQGTFYINRVGYFIKLDAIQDSTIWLSNTINLSNAVNNPMCFDGNYFYHGNYNGITNYSAQNGQPIWSFSWVAFSDAIPYREVAFSDSTVFVAAPTSMWDWAQLFCLKKSTGALVWQKPIDKGSVSVNFNSIPIVYNNSVILLTRDQNNQQFLTSYNISNGSQLWSVSVSNNMSSKLWLLNGKLYSAYGLNAFCFDANNGSLLWQTNLNTTNYLQTYNFLEANQLFVVKVLSNSNYKVITVNIAGGTIENNYNITVPTTYSTYAQLYAPLGCAYRNNQLVLASYNTVDSLDIISFDIAHSVQKWKTRVANSLLTGEEPLITDKYVIFPINDNYNTPNNALSNMIFMDLNGNIVKKLPYHSTYTDRFYYKENGVQYEQMSHF